MKKNYFKVLLVSAALLISASSSQAAPRTCQGCKELLALKEPFEATRDRGVDAHYPQLQKVSAAIGKLKRTADGSLDKQQAEAIIEMLGIERDREYRQLLVEKNITLFRDNRDLIAKVAQHHSGDVGAAVVKDIDIVIRVYDKGQDPAPEKAPAKPGAPKAAGK